MERPYRRRSFLGPILLIALGVIFLLNNLGVLSWNVWATLIRLWPVLLIGFGLDLLIGRRSVVGSVTVVLLVLAVVTVAVWGFAAQPVPGGEAITSEEISQPLNGASRADVQITLGVGTLRLDSLPQSDQLMQGQVSLLPGEKVTRDFSLANDTANYRLRSQSSPGIPFTGWSGDEHAWDLSLNGSIPTKLQINSGVGSNSIDLSQMNITDLDIKAGVGKVSVTMPARGTIQARVEGGVGEVDVIIPAGMAARIDAKTGIGGVDVSGPYRQQGNSYVSPGFDSAQNRIDLRVNGGVGRIVVQQYAGQQAAPSPSSASILPQGSGA